MTHTFFLTEFGAITLLTHPADCVALSKTLNPNVVEALYQCIFLTKHNIAQFVSAHRDTPSQSRLATVSGLSMWWRWPDPQDAVDKRFSEFCWLLEQTKPRELDLYYKEIWTPAQHSSLLAILKDCPLRSLRLTCHEGSPISRAMDIITVGGPQLHSLGVQWVSQDNSDDQPYLPASELKIAEPSVNAGPLQSVRLFEADQTIICQLAAVNGGHRIWFRDEALPNLEILTLPLWDPTEYDEYEEGAADPEPGAQFLLEQHGHKLRHLTVMGVEGTDYRLPPALATACPHLRSIYLSNCNSANLQRLPPAAQHVMVASCWWDDVKEYVEVLRSDAAGTLLSGLRNFTIKWYWYANVDRHSRNEDEEAEENTETIA